MIAAWASAFALTLVVETAVAYGLARWLALRADDVVLVLASTTAVTHPTLWFVLPAFFADYTTYIVLGELGVVVVEAVALRRVGGLASWRDALAISALANAASFGVGLFA